MKHRMIPRFLLALTVSILTCAVALAAPPGQDRHERDHDRGRPAQRAEPNRRPPPPPRRVAPARRAPAPTFHFEDRHRGSARDYFRREYTKGRCPPGLTRRGAGCAPRAARAWTRGRVLPRTVVYYEVPAPLIGALPPPPRGHRYVRVAGDILLIAIGSGLVIDAIQDIFD
ncbi:MAG: RcnB family protein [Zoogloeaceae bacterium]|jgi:Ni/Co efflux regulator RcnB|nr:RcnB family protein [Zoogloeaceae bacterium]